jgi:arylsulfatase A-like enzyme
MKRQRLGRRDFLLLSAAAVVSVLIPASRMIGRLQAGKKPNILFILSDQQRWDTVGCYGQALDVTPNLDRMAAEGVRFENAFTCQPLCGPARACIQTGKYATEIGVIRNGAALPLDELTIAHHLSGAGYEVGYIGKWHLASNHSLEGPDLDFREKPVPPERRGGYKDYWLASDALEYTSHGYDGHMFNANMEAVHFPEGRYRVDAQTDWVLDYLGTQDRQRPFFLFVSYLEPHHQNDHNQYEGPVGSKERFKDFAVPGDLVGTGGDWRKSYPDYLGCVNSLDENLGRIRDELERLGLDKDTLLIYTSDHGSHFRTRNEEYKRSCHEASIRVPLIAYGPGFRGGKVIRELVSLIDIAPTVLAAGGVEIPDHMRGRPLRDLTGGKHADWPEEVFVQISVSQLGRAIRTHRWKYSVSAPGRDAANELGSDFYVEEFLYDLESDPHERNNLVWSPDHVEIRATLCERLKHRIAAAGEQIPTIVPAAAYTEALPGA